MKHKIFTTIAILLIYATGTFAQNGKILYTDFEPDSCYVRPPMGVYLDLDMDEDGINEIEFGGAQNGHNGNPWVIICRPLLSNIETWNVCRLWENDSVLSDMDYSHPFLDICDPEEFPYYYSCNSPSYDFTSQPRLGVRKLVGEKDGVESYCYGWIEMKARWIWDKPHWSMTLIACVDRMAYCTIPDYPLVYGQTSLDGIDETEAAAFAHIHPNPTSGLVTVSGENLKELEVINILGQPVLKTGCSGESVTIDLANQPAGVYFIKITDKNGRNYSEKVVRE